MTVWQKEKFGRFWEFEARNFTESEFKERLRMYRSTFNYLLNEIGPVIKKENTNWRMAIPVEKRLAVAIYALASSAEYATIGYLFGIGRTTVGEIVLDVCDAINSKLLKKFINGYPATEAKIMENISGFEEKWGFPQCYSAIDGCHIEVNPPKEDATDYYNYKGWYSTVLFAAVDYRYRFTYINVGSPGRNNDAFIYNNSKLKKLHNDDTTMQKYTKNINGVEIPVLLIGDSAFPLSNNLMKPFPFKTTQSEREKHFNFILSRSRRVVENAFGHVKARFRRIGKGLEVDISNASTIIKACCTLHNICNERNDDLLEYWISDDTREQPVSNSIVGENVSQPIRMRSSIADYLFQNKN